MPLLLDVAVMGLAGGPLKTMLRNLKLILMWLPRSLEAFQKEVTCSALCYLAVSSSHIVLPSCK